MRQSSVEPRELVAFAAVDELPAGLYEVLVTEGLKARLNALSDALPTEQRALHAAETPDRVAWHLSREIERALADVPDKDRAQVGIDVARALIDRLGDVVERAAKWLREAGAPRVIEGN